MNKNSQTICIGLSFTVIGLILGLLITGGSLKVFGANLFGAEAENKFVDEYDFEVLDVSVDDDAFLGDENAPVIMIEFSDFQCPYCAKFVQETFPLIKQDYIDKGLVKFVYRDLPLGGHAYAHEAAQAAECVGEAGGNEAYYEMHDSIFANMASLSAAPDATVLFEAYATELGHDISSCLANGDMSDEVDADFVAGRSYGVEGTPTFFINGQKIQGAYPYSVLKTIIDSAL